MKALYMDNSFDASNILPFNPKKTHLSHQNGGRYPKAIKLYKGLTPIERLMLLNMCEALDFREDFTAQTYFHSAKQWAEELEISDRSAQTHARSLHEKGIWIQTLPSTKEQMKKGMAATYQLTSKIFDHFEELQKESAKNKHNSAYPGEKFSPPPVQEFHPPGEKFADHFPVLNPKTKSFFSEPKKKLGSVKVEATVLTNFLRSKTPDNFYNFNDSVAVIESVLVETHISLPDLSNALSELKNWVGVDFLISSKNTHPKTIEALLVRWIKERSKVEEEYAERKKPKIIEKKEAVPTSYPIDDEEVQEMLRSLTS